ncbi:MAG: phage portal protein [Cetobacterium sp.]
MGSNSNLSKIRVNKVEELSTELIGQLVQYQLNSVVPHLTDLYNLYKGEHKILEKQVKGNKPNNRLVADYYGKIIDTEVGYFLGKPVVFNMDELDAKEELENILIDNHFDDVIMEVGKESSIKGISYIMLYQDEETNTNICRLEAESVLTLKKHLGNDVGVAIRYYVEYLVDGEERYHIEVYDDEKVVYYVMQGEEVVLDNTVSINPCNHIYGVVPIIPVINNEEQLGSFEKVTSLVNAYDKLLSDTSNEHEAYRNAYLVLKNISLEKGTDLTQTEVIELVDDGEASFLTKPILDSAINSQLDRLRKDIYTFVDVPDLSDENFGGNLSGVAIKFKLFGLETKCVIKERKMTRALYILLKALRKVLFIKTGEDVETNKVQILFTRNIPMNILEVTQVVTQLNGIVDKETLLSLLPFIDNPQEVMDKLEEEQESYKNDMVASEENIFPSSKKPTEEVIGANKDTSIGDTKNIQE